MSENAATTAHTARRAYETLEPFHVVSYFSPLIADAADDLGLDASAFYVGARAAPIGEASSAVITAAFYSFAPAVIDTGWQASLRAGLAEIHDRRYAMLDHQFGEILGDRDVEDLVSDLGDVAARLPLGGRTLASAWAATDVPERPLAALWRAVAVLREWRGDNHLAELIRHGLSGLEAGVLHEAELPDPTVKRRVVGRRFFTLTRGWTDADWDGAVAALAARGLVQTTDSGHRLTPEGMAIYTDIEAGTDAISGQVFGAADADLIERFRPISKAVIDAGILPGTKRK